MANNGINIVLALGSNCGQLRNVRYAMGRLREFFPGIRFSRILRTSPIGIDSDWFANALAVGTSRVSAEDIVECLKEIERECGRCADDKARNVVKLDIDLLEYGDAVLREKDWKRDYVQRLRRELEVDSPV